MARPLNLAPAVKPVECQAHYVTRLLNTMFERGAEAIEVRRDVHEAYNARIDHAHERMVWTHPGVDNWYRNARRRVTVITPWCNDDFWGMTREADPSQYLFA